MKEMIKKPKKTIIKTQVGNVYEIVSPACRSVNTGDKSSFVILMNVDTWQCFHVPSNDFFLWMEKEKAVHIGVS